MYRYFHYEIIENQNHVLSKLKGKEYIIQK